MSETPATYNAGHHPHGPSQIGNPCNASWKLSQWAPEPPASEDADEGTLLHSLVANPDPAAIAAMDEEQQRTVNACLTQAEAWADQIGDSRPFYEEWLELRDGDALVNSGTLDFLAKTRTGTHGILGDWKMGRLPSAGVADQCANYVAAAFQRWPGLVSIEAYAWYPRAPKLNQCWTYDRSDLAGLIERIKARIAIRESRERWEPTLGDHCKHCRGAILCGPRQRELAELAAAQGVEVAQPTMTIETLDGPSVAAMLPRIKRADAIITAIKARAKALAGAGELPGYRLAEVRGREKLDGETLDIAASLDLAHWTPEEVWQAVRFDLALLRAVAKAKPLPADAVLAPKMTPADYHLATVAGYIARAPGYRKLVEEQP